MRRRPNQSKPDEIRIRGVDPEGHVSIACTLVPMTLPSFITFHGHFGAFGSTYTYIDELGRGVPGKRGWPRISDWFVSEPYSSVVRLVKPKKPGIYMITLIMDDPTQAGIPESYYAIYHNKRWHQVRENNLLAARAGLDYLSYSSEAGQTNYYA